MSVLKNPRLLIRNIFETVLQRVKRQQTHHDFVTVIHPPPMLREKSATALHVVAVADINIGGHVEVLPTTTTATCLTYFVIDQPEDTKKLDGENKMSRRSRRYK